MLSEAVAPAFYSVPKYHSTAGPEVADLAELANFAPDPEQRLALDAIFAMDKHGASVAFETCVICSRQNLKTGLFKQCALGWLFITDQRLSVWSAHEFRTAQEAFRDMTELLDSSDYLRRRVKQVYRGNGDEAIEMLSGARLIFKARTKGGGRGLSGDKVVLDEGFALQPLHMGALIPTLSARPDPQVVTGSSAGLADSEVLRGMRDRGREALGTIAYLEWCAEDVKDKCAEKDCSHVYGRHEGCVLDDEDNWRRANPALGRRIKVETIRAERQTLPALEFARERLGWWDDPGVIEPAFGTGAWESCGSDFVKFPKRGLALGLAVSLDREWGSLGTAGVRKEKILVGATDRRRGVDWLPERAAEIQRKHDLEVVIDGGGPAATLIPRLEAAGVRLTVATTSDVLDACAGIYDAVQEKRLVHANHPELNAAVNGAQKRPVMDRWAWGRKVSITDVSMLEAVTLAAWSVDVGGEADPSANWI